MPIDQQAEILGLRQEVNDQNKDIYLNSRYILSLMTALWVIAVAPWGTPMAAIPIPMLGLTWVYSLDRADFLIHRAGAFLKSAGSEWENSWQRHFRKWLLVPLDLYSMSIFLFYMQQALWMCWEIPGWKVYSVVTGLVFAKGALGIGLLANMFEQEAKRRSKL
jgi:hypothetical protein